MITGELPESDVIPGVSTELKAFFEDDEEEEGSYILEDDQKVEEVMHELLKEINGGGSDDNGKKLGVSPSFYLSGESCGPAFSGSGSTLMAGIEMVRSSGTRSCNLLEGGGVVGLGGPTIEMFSGLEMGFDVKNNNGPWLMEGKGKAQKKEEGGKEEKMEGWDEEEGEDEWLTRVLSCAPQVLEDYGM